MQDFGGFSSRDLKIVLLRLNIQSGEELSSGTLPPRVGGNKYRDSQLNNVQRVRDLRTLSPEWVSPSNPSPKVSGNPTEKETRF